MSDLAAIAKHACPACGAPAEWNPAKQRLVCPFCGTEAPFDVNAATGAIEEIDLVKTLREMPDDLRGWKAEKRSVQCQSCKAVMVFDPTRVGQNCDFCGSPALVDYKELKDPIRPQSLLPFKVSQTQVRENIRRWYASKWFAPNAFKAKALVDTVKGVYVPYWTFDAQVHCPWWAEAGYYYYTTETFRNNQGQTETRQVQHVRWEPASGVIDHFFDDEPVPGTQGVDAGIASSGRAVSDKRAGAIRYSVSVGVCRRALPNRFNRRGETFSGADAPEVDGSVRPAGARRHAAEPADRAGRTRDRPSSTCWCRSGCSRTPMDRSGSRSS